MWEALHWGIVNVAAEFVPTFEAYLPPDHKVIAVRHLDDGCDECIVSGPRMPLFAPGKDPVRTDIRLSVDESGATYCYWTHAPAERWRV